MENTENVASFRCALEQTPHGKYMEVKRRLKKALGIKTDAGLMFKVNGLRPVTLPQVYKVEEIFKDYGIKVEWGCQKEEEEDREITGTKIFGEEE
jgi:hypothetical protein